MRDGVLAPDLTGSIGNLGAAQFGVALCDVLERAEPGQVIVVLSLADGADAFVLRTTPALVEAQRARAEAGVPSVAEQVAAGRDDLTYANFLTWRSQLRREPPRRPDPERPGAPTVHRSEEWKYAFAASRCLACGFRHMPPTRACLSCHAIDQMQPERLADVPGTVATFTIDHLAYSMSPPVIGVIIDFDGGGRFRCELTDAVASELSIGDRVAMTFRRVWTAQGVHNYFWKARPCRPDVTRRRGARRVGMGSSGIRDQVAIIGMGCTRFGELWDKGVDDLMIESSTDAAASAGMSIHDVDAFWLGTMTSGVCGVTLSRPLKLDYKPVTRVENYCATGSEAFRNACYAVASGAYDIAMAVGVEKLKDTGYSGLTGVRLVGRRHRPRAVVSRRLLVPGSLLRPQVRRRPGPDEGGHGPDRLQEPPERGAEPEGAVPEGSLHGDHRQGAAGGRATSASSTAAA